MHPMTTSNLKNKPLIYVFPDKVLYIGRLPPNETHSIPVATLSLNLNNSFQVSANRGEKWHKCRSVFWPANLPHESIYNNDVMVFFLMEPTAYYRAFENNMLKQKDGFYYMFENEEKLLESFIYIYQERPHINHIDKLLEDSLSLSLNKKDIYIDDRVEKVIQIIKNEPASKQTIKELSDDVGLSEPYIMELFKEQAGMPIGKFQLWIKLLLAVRLVLFGHDATSAAIAGGFSDTAHFSRTFKSMIGMSMSSVFMAKNRLDVFLDPNLLKFSKKI